MTLDKAKSLLNMLLLPMPDPFDPDYQDAIKLGIEALERIKQLKSVPLIYTQRLLPGETEE